MKKHVLRFQLSTCHCGKSVLPGTFTLVHFSPNDDQSSFSFPIQAEEIRKMEAYVILLETSGIWSDQ